MISIPGLRERDITQVRVSTCNPGRIFVDAQAADGWLDQHPEGIVLPVADAYPQLRPIIDRLLAEDTSCRTSPRRLGGYAAVPNRLVVAGARGIAR